jgi:hypothetical protein
MGVAKLRLVVQPAQPPLRERCARPDCGRCTEWEGVMRVWAGPDRTGPPLFQLVFVRLCCEHAMDHVLRQLSLDEFWVLVDRLTSSASMDPPDRNSMEIEMRPI